MCLVIRSLSFKRIALCNIVVYKHLESNGKNPDYRTPYRGTIVKMGETYESDLSRVCNDVDAGLHSFGKKKDAISDGRSECSDVVVKCIIPFGSRYYKGKFAGKVSFASDKLRYVGVIEHINRTEYTN